MSNDERGIWGGTTDAERRRQKRAIRRERISVVVQRAEPRPVSADPEWRTIDERVNTVNRPVRLVIAENGAGWHGFGFAVFRDDELLFLADNEPDAWLYFQSALLT